MKRYIKKALAPTAALLIAMASASCISDLDSEPISPKIDTEVSLDGLFNKCYANFAINGNGSGSTSDDDSDVKGYSDSGMTGLVRQMWNMNELPTDEAFCSWGDGGISEFNFATFDASHSMSKAFFVRLTLGITCCNQYLEEATNEDATKIAEIRFLRALQYYLLMDAYGNVPFAEKQEKPVQYTRKQMYDWLVEELTTNVEPNLMTAQAKKSTDANYGRVDKAAAWLLLSRLYLNAEIYTGTADWQNAKTYAEKVMNSSYQLNTTSVGQWSAYQMLFMGDNGETDAAYETLFPILNTSDKITSYGNSLFLIASTFDTSMHANPEDPDGNNGCSSRAWDGNHARPDLVKKFFPNSDAPNVPSYDMPSMAGDDRAIFWGEGRTLDVSSTTKSEGFGVCKFINYKSDGSSSVDPTFADMDWPFLRAAEAYLNYAEADAHLNGGQTSTAGTNAINALRSRANATTRTTSYSLNDICDEWAREFYFEGIRRVTLIRFGRFGGNTGYTWQWKGGDLEGKNIAAYRNIYPIPTSQLQSNTNLVQNPGYSD